MRSTLDRLEATSKSWVTSRRRRGARSCWPEGLLLPGSLSPDCPPPCRDDRVGGFLRRGWGMKRCPGRSPRLQARLPAGGGGGTDPHRRAHPIQLLRPVGKIPGCRPFGAGKALLRPPGQPGAFTQEGHAIYDPCAPGSRLGITAAEFKPELLHGHRRAPYAHPLRTGGGRARRDAAGL